MPDAQTTTRPGSRPARFAFTKFRPTILPETLVPRSDLLSRLSASATARLTLVTGSAGSGKSVLVATWAATRPARSTAWLACDEADATPLRFCFALIEAMRTVSPGFGADTAELLTIDAHPSADALGLLVNDLATVPEGTAIVVDDFHLPESGVVSLMDHLIERWPPNIRLVLASRSEPALRLHRLRVAGALVELRDADLRFSLVDSRRLLENFGVEIEPAALADLHQRTEGWVTSVQMAALAARATRDTDGMVKALDPHAIASYFVAEVLDHQPKEIAAFMLDSSVLDELTAEMCVAVTEKVDAPLLLRIVDAGNLFLIPLDDERTTYRYHHLIREVLRAELRARDRGREAELHERTAAWFQSIGDNRQAIRHLLHAEQPERAGRLLFETLLPDFFAHPVPEEDFGLAGFEAAVAQGSPELILALAMELLLRGDVARGVEYVDLLEQSGSGIQPDSMLGARLDALRSLRHALMGETDAAIERAGAARATAARLDPDDSWVNQLAVAVANVHVWRRDYEAVERELRSLRNAGPHVKGIQVAGIRAIALADAGHVDVAGALVETIATEAARAGLDRHVMAINYWRAQARVAMERREFDNAAQFAHTAVTIAEGRRPGFEFLAHLDQAEILLAGGHFNAALSEIGIARVVLPSASPVLLSRIDLLEALLLAAWGDLSGAAEAAAKVPGNAGAALRTRIALVRSDAATALAELGPEPPAGASPRDRLMHLVLRAGIAVELQDATVDGLVQQLVDASGRYGFIHTVVASTTQVTSYLLERSAGLYQTPHLDRLLAAAIDTRANQAAAPARRPLIDPLTERELTVLRLLPTSLSAPQIASKLYVSLNTIKTHLRRIYMKLDAGSRTEAVRRAVELRLL